MEGEERWCVVTGGRGFAARYLVQMLIRYDMFSVRIVDSGLSINLDTSEDSGILGEALRSGRARYVSADLRDKSQVLKALHGAEVVFHMAAPDSSINSYELHHSISVKGTKNVTDACIELNVKRLVYTSSPSVVFDGVLEIINGDESLPYPAKHNDSYAATKAEGEVIVIKANGINGLLTCCIRPSGIFGPGDKFVPSLVSAARAGILKFLVGKGNNMYDFTFVENVAHAHICAERALASGKAVAERAAGQSYFITNLEPIKFWEFVSLILEGLGYERPIIKVPVFVIMPIVYLVEWTYKLLAKYGMKAPQLTPPRVRLLSCSRTFKCSKAIDRLGYTPIILLEEGLRMTIESYLHLRADQHKKDGPSKASLLLGGGRAADILLWRDERQTLATIIILLAIYVNFIAAGYSLISAIAKLLLGASIFLFLNGILPEKILGYTIEKIRVSNFCLSEEKSHQVALSMASSWNSAASSMKSLCKGNDWSLFLKVILSLLTLILLGAVSPQNFFVIGLPIVFIAFAVYEKKEEQIDCLVSRIISFRCKLNSDSTQKLDSKNK
ncbi:3-beta-hydroxysteroid-4-alpha-carboxylate 3-dehydrogenase (decarboxylating) [Bertholletia excelsa]